MSHRLDQPRMPMVDPSNFAMVPKSDVPRSTFKTTHTYKSTFDFDYLVPIHVDEVLPGDVHKGDVTIFARLSNLLFPLMDNLEVETFFFFVPARLVWQNWKKFMGEQTNPADTIAYTIPLVTGVAGGFAVGSLYDYLGLPTAGQITGVNLTNVNALPLRAYNLIWNEWFRDENLQNSLTVLLTDGPDPSANYTLQKRNKKHDYFTSALPWPLKGGVEVPFFSTGQAIVKTSAARLITTGGSVMTLSRTTGAVAPAGVLLGTRTTNSNFESVTTPGPVTADGLDLLPDNLYADLATASGSTINQLRLSAATQQFLEKDARGGTRYTELLKNHFGVTPEDARLQRPEYIGGGRSPIHTDAIPQTSATGITGGSTQIGSLTGQGTVSAQHRFSYHATEHGYIIGLANVTGDVTYSQGLRRLWTRATRYDFYWPVFANLGEQAVRNDEIYAQGTATDTLTFGYQERWAEYRYRPSMITGLFRPTSTGQIAQWHLSQVFGSLPVLNTTFITQATPGIRVLAAGAGANGLQVLFDSVFAISCTRPIPTYSVPGLTRF
ncbi:MAG: major capsid protein [Microvirus sp.]|nr:MAG: major capsid protein [Microvirus sp.]